MCVVESNKGKKLGQSMCEITLSHRLWINVPNGTSGRRVLLVVAYLPWSITDTTTAEFTYRHDCVFLSVPRDWLNKKVV